MHGDGSYKISPFRTNFREIIPVWWRICILYFRGERRAQAWWLLTLTMCLNVVTTYILGKLQAGITRCGPNTPTVVSTDSLAIESSHGAVIFSGIQRDVSNGLVQKDQGAFRDGIIRFATLVGLSSPIFAAVYYLQERLALEWRRWMTETALRKYYKGSAYYRLSIAGNAEAAHEDRVVDETSPLTGTQGIAHKTSAHTRPTQGAIDNPDQRICDDIR